jgi:hypothetical protein
MKKNILIFLIALFSLSLGAQNNYSNIVKLLNSNVPDSILLLGGDLRIYNLYKSEYKYLYNSYLTKDTTQLYNQFYSTSYVPFAQFWNSFGFDSTRSVNYLRNNKNNINFDNLSARIKNVIYSNLDSLFTVIAHQMYEFTGYKIKGNWYLGCLVNWCDLCGNGKIMYIDLLFESVNYDHIKLMLPHEFSHQIFNLEKSNDSIAGTCFGYFINEGLASYVNYLFWNKVYSPAKSLLYTDEEYKWCLSNENQIFKDAEKKYFSTNRDDINKYQNASFRVYDDGPSRLAYFIGFRICEKYVKKYGKDSWKDFYRFSYSEILNRLRFI